MGYIQFLLLTHIHIVTLFAVVFRERRRRPRAKMELDRRRYGSAEKRAWRKRKGRWRRSKMMSNDKLGICSEGLEILQQLS